MTLRDLFEIHHEPHLQNHERSHRTLKEYRKSLDYWDDAVGDMDVATITESHIVQFKRHLSELRGKQPGSRMATNTIRKHLRAIRSLFLLAGPKDSRNKRGMGLTDEIVDIAMPQEVYRNAEDALTLEEISIWINQVKKRHGTIDGVPSNIWWESILTLVYNTGIRIGSVLEMRWSWISNGVIHIQKMSGVKSSYPVVMNHEAVCVINTMRELSKQTDPDDRVFAWDRTRYLLWKHAENDQNKAGIPKERRFKFHGIRKYFGGELAKQNLAIATKALGHTSPDVTSQYYLNTKQVVSHAIEQIIPLGKVAETWSKKTSEPPTPKPQTQTQVSYADGWGSMCVFIQ